MFRRMPSGTANISHLQRFSWVPKGADIEPPLNVLQSLRLTNGKSLVMNASVNIRKLTVTMGAKAPILYRPLNMFHQDSQTEEAQERLC